MDNMTGRVTVLSCVRMTGLAVQVQLRFREPNKLPGASEDPRLDVVFLGGVMYGEFWAVSRSRSKTLPSQILSPTRKHAKTLFPPVISDVQGDSWGTVAVC